MLANPQFDPFTNKKDQLAINSELAHEIVFTL